MWTLSTSGLGRILKNDRKKMSILKEILARSNKSRMVMATGAVLFASSSSLSASCFALENTVHFDPQHVLVDQVESNGTEYESDLGPSIIEFLKSGLSLLRNNPLKAMTIFLAVQSQGSRFSMPATSAAFAVTNTNQVRLYDVSDPNPVVPLMPMVITGVVTPCNATIVLSDITAGNLTSVGTGLAQKFDKGVWTSQGDGVGLLTNLLSNLRVSIAADYDKDFNLSVDVYDLSARTINRVQGVIQIMPTAGGTTTSQTLTVTNSAATTSTTPKVTTTKSLVITTTSSKTTPITDTTTLAGTDATSSTLSKSQDLTHSAVSSPVSPIPNSPTTPTTALTSASKTKALSITETSQIPLVGPSSEPPYAAIGGGLVGGVALLGGIAAVVAAKRGLICGGNKKSADEEAQDPEKALRNQYGKVQVASGNGYDPVVIPQTHANHTYGKVVVAEQLKSEYDAPQQPISGFSQYGSGPAEKSPYENVDAPLS